MLHFEVHLPLSKDKSAVAHRVSSKCAECEFDFSIDRAPAAKTRKDSPTPVPTSLGNLGYLVTRELESWFYVILHVAAQSKRAESLLATSAEHFIVPPQLHYPVSGCGVAREVSNRISS